MAKKITIEGLATMVMKGFEKTSTKEQVEKLEYRMDKVEKKLDKIEGLIVEDHRKRLEKLEMRVEYLENVISLPNKK